VEKPEVGGGGGNEVYDPALSPESVLSNFSKAIQYKNIEEYMKCFAPSEKPNEHAFYFEPEPYFKDQFADTRWTRTEERNYFTQLSISVSTTYPKLNLSFTDGVPALTPITQSAPNDSMQSQSVEYILRVDQSTDSVAVYRGLMRLKLYRSPLNDRWYIYYWRDNALNKQYNQSWTFLKLYFQKHSKL